MGTAQKNVDRESKTIEHLAVAVGTLGWAVLLLLSIYQFRWNTAVTGSVMYDFYVLVLVLFGTIWILFRGVTLGYMNPGTSLVLWDRAFRYFLFFYGVWLLSMGILLIERYVNNPALPANPLFTPGAAGTLQSIQHPWVYWVLTILILLMFIGTIYAWSIVNFNSTLSKHVAIMAGAARAKARSEMDAYLETTGAGGSRAERRALRTLRKRDGSDTDSDYNSESESETGGSETGSETDDE